MNLGVDIIDEILSRLPVKSLITFKVVCKDWYSHIHSDCFIAKHLKNQNTNKKALIYHGKDGINDYVVSICNEEEKEEDDNDDDDDDDEDHDSQILFHQHQIYRIKDYSKKSDVNLIGTCNGLVCRDHTEWNYHHPTYKRIITLSNPATGDFKTLPCCESQGLPPATHESCLIGEHIGFGFDSTSNDYKVIRVGRCNEEELVNKAMVYSLKTNSWRELDHSNVLMKIFIPNSTVKFGSTMLLSDKVYWSVLAFDMLENAVLLSFDMHKEVFQITPLPSEYIASRTQYCDESPICFTLHDSIAIVGRKYIAGTMRLEIWITKELEQGHTSWSKLSNIGLSSRSLMPLGFWKCKNSNDFLFFFVHKKYDHWDCNEEVMKGVYINNRGEIKNDKMMTIKVNNNIVVPLKFLKFLNYVESLVSVNRA